LIINYVEYLIIQKIF